MGSGRFRVGKKRLAIIGVALLPLFAFLPVRALITNGTMPDGGFEIEGNLQVDGGAGSFDWANAGGSGGPTACSGLVPGAFSGPMGALNLLCARDSATGQSDNSLSGHENDTSIQVVCGSIPNGKADLSNFYVASQSAPVTAGGKPHSFLYLGWTINSTGGSADMDFEFNQLAQPAALQDGTALGQACPSGSGVTANVGSSRSANDLLIEYQFAAGGNSVTVKLAKWTLTGPCAAGSAPCWGTETDLTTAGFASAAINDASTPDKFGGANCPAPNTPKSQQQDGCVTNALSGGTLGPQQFGEAAIDLTNALPSSTNGCETLGSAYLKSRSSATFTDAVKDYIAPVPVHITNCTTPTVTTSLSTNTANPGSSVSDSATITNFLGSSLGGTVAFNVYSGTGSSACTGTPAETVPAGANATTGASGATLTTNGTSATTGAITITDGTSLSAGHYEIQAVYSGDGAANLTAKSVCGTEPLQIRAQPTLITSLSSTSANLGTSVTDTGILSNFLGTNPPGGTVTFNVYSGTGIGVCTGSAVESLPSGGASLSAGTGSNTGDAVATTTLTTGTGTAPTLAPGSYEVQAVYTGDSGNNLSASSNCGDESLTINKVQPTITTQASPTTAFTVGTSTAISDTATFSGSSLVSGIAPTGSVAFTLYSDSTCTTAATYAATDSHTGIVTGTGSISTTSPYAATFSTTWTPTLAPATNPTYTWGISWLGDGNYLAVPQTGVQCGGANETLSVQKATPTLSTKIQLDDIATLGSGYNVSASDTVTFKLFSGGTCTGTPVAEFDNLAVSGGTATTVGATPDSGTNVVSSAGTYDWQVTFSGDSFNNSVTSGCTTANHETATISYAGQ